MADNNSNIVNTTTTVKEIKLKNIQLPHTNFVTQLISKIGGFNMIVMNNDLNKILIMDEDDSITKLEFKDSDELFAWIRFWQIRTTVTLFAPARLKGVILPAFKAQDELALKEANWVNRNSTQYKVRPVFMPWVNLFDPSIKHNSRKYEQVDAMIDTYMDAKDDGSLKKMTKKFNATKFYKDNAPKPKAAKVAKAKAA